MNMSGVSYADHELAIMREGGSRLVWIMQQLEGFLHVGLAVNEIEYECERLIGLVGAESATKGYKSDAPTPFPSVICVSINDDVVHGIARDNPYVLKNDDLVSLDVVIKYQEMYVDICRTFVVGEASEPSHEIISASKAVTMAAIHAALLGNTTDDIGRAAERAAHMRGYEVVRDLGGHGVGRELHMSPFVPNFARSGYKDKLHEGMILAIEPIITTGNGKVHIREDNWTFRTNDGARTAQYEETVLLTEKGPEILTVHNGTDYLK